MSLAAAAVVASMPVLGSVHLDADAQGRGLLTWSGYRGNRYVTQVMDVTTGRRQQLWSSRSVSIMDLADFDVAASGAAVACFRDRASENAQTWRVLIRRRSPDGVWSGRRLVAAPKAWVDGLRCGVGDAGQVALTWTHSGGRRQPAMAAYVAADGSMEAPTRLAAEVIDEPEIAVGPDGSATVAFTTGRDDRVLHVSEHPAAGAWTTRAIAPAFGPELAMDGTGRAVLAWDDPGEVSQALSFAAGPSFAPAPFVNERGTYLRALAAGPRGDVLAAWATDSYPRAGALRVAVSRPGAPFSAPTLIGHFAAFPLLATLNTDGGGAVAAVSGSERRPRPYVRVLRPDGTWGARIKVQHEPAGLAPAGPGRFTLATAQRDRYGSYRVLRVRVLPKA
ncbi:hypothetical protein OJ998_24225 [Solirubrobacter taibaiensis]|nr:hypothetical protein [Solirubrobacter taibaiensis]